MVEIALCILVMTRLTLYVDQAYWMSQLASSYINMTCLEMAFIVHAPVCTFTYTETTGFLHSATYSWHIVIQDHSAIPSRLTCQNTIVMMIWVSWYKWWVSIITKHTGSSGDLISDHIIIWMFLLILAGILDHNMGSDIKPNCEYLFLWIVKYNQNWSHNGQINDGSCCMFFIFNQN